MLTGAVALATKIASFSSPVISMAKECVNQVLFCFVMSRDCVECGVKVALATGSV